MPKVIQPKGLYLVRPSMQQYLSTREELDEASKTMFEKISSRKVKIKIFKKYKLDEVLLARIIFGSCCLSMITSIIFFIREIQISTNALKLHMSDMDVDVN